MCSHSRSGVAFISLVALALASLVSGRADAGAVTPKRCASVVAVGVRGSGETSTDAGGLGATVSIAINRFKQLVGRGVTVEPIDYPSLGLQVALVDPARYYAGSRIGIDTLTATIRRQARTCPREPIAVFGYSQGAMVVNRALVELARSHPMALRSVAAVALIADPQRIGGASYTWGTAPHQLNGLGIYIKSLAIPGAGFPGDDLPTQVQKRSRSTCVDGDLVCAWDTTRTQAQVLTPASLAAAGRAHSSYATNGYARDAGSHASQTLKRFKVS